VSWNAPGAGNCEQHAASCLQVLPEAVRGLLILKHMCLYSYCTRLCVMKLTASYCHANDLLVDDTCAFAAAGTP
jgi:hypothetical protein